MDSIAKGLGVHLADLLGMPELSPRQSARRACEWRFLTVLTP
jgi:hypothetical protein